MPWFLPLGYLVELETKSNLQQKAINDDATDSMNNNDVDDDVGDNDFGDSGDVMTM